MLLCQCDVCLTTRARVIDELAQLGNWHWWLHTQKINEEARRACEAARAEGYVDPPSRFPRGIPAG